MHLLVSEQYRFQNPRKNDNNFVRKLKNPVVSYLLECSYRPSRLSVARSALYDGVILTRTRFVFVNNSFSFTVPN